MLGFRLGLFGSRGRAALERVEAAGDILRGDGNIADDAGADEGGGGILRRIGDLKQLCAGRDSVAGNESVVEKNGCTENDDGVISGELGGEWFLRGQQAAAKKAMRARKCPARGDRLGVNVGIRSLGEGDYVAPSAILFHLRAGDEG